MKLEELMPSIYSINWVAYDYETIKCSLYEEIIDSFLKKGMKSTNPKFIHVSGGPASGKTSFCKEKGLRDGLFIAFDTIMSLIPQYQQDIKSEGLLNAFHAWEMPARVIGYELLRRAVENRFDIVFESGGINESYLELFAKLKSLGYNVHIDFLLCDIKIAHERSEARAKEINRATPRNMIEERYALVSEYLDKYKTASDSMNIYDTTSGKFDIDRAKT